MKKTILFIFLLTILLMFTSCDNSENSTQNTGDTTSQIEINTNKAESNTNVTEADTTESSPKNTSTQSKQPIQTEITEHEHKYTVKTTAATCQKQGYTTHTCSCGDTYTDNYVNGQHEYVNNKCQFCNKANLDNLYEHLKNWVIENGTVNGDYVYYSKTADNYGGYNSEDFSLYFWNDTGKIEFCLHSVLDNKHSINFYVYIPREYNGNYEYITSYYYRDNGQSICESRGIIQADSFTKNYPLNSTEYFGSSDLQNNFMEMSRTGICDTLNILEQFLKKENIGYTLLDLGFDKFS